MWSSWHKTRMVGNVKWELSSLHPPEQYLLDSNLSEWFTLIISLFFLVNTIQKNSPGNTEFLSSNFQVAQGKQQPIIIPADYKWLLSEELCSILFSFVTVQDGLWWPKIKNKNSRWETDQHCVVSDDPQMSQVGYIFFEHISISQEQHLLAKLFSEIKCRSGIAHTLYRPQCTCEIFSASTQTQLVSTSTYQQWKLSPKQISQLFTLRLSSDA